MSRDLVTEETLLAVVREARETREPNLQEEAVLMIMHAAPYNEMAEGPLMYMTRALWDVIDKISGLSQDDTFVHQVMARTILDSMPIPHAIYNAMVDAHNEFEHELEEVMTLGGFDGS